MFDVPRGKYIGKPLGGPIESEREHFIKCPACGGWIDCRDLGQVFEHEGPLRGRIFCGKPEATFPEDAQSSHNMGAFKTNAGFQSPIPWPFVGA